ncbi:MAG: ATP-binding cassette domain-containing protein [Sphingomonadales bacterium]|nr:ATP-binding cassette domain-containing protein [Sphingomonadales bacterium]
MALSHETLQAWATGGEPARHGKPRLRLVSRAAGLLGGRRAEDDEPRPELTALDFVAALEILAELCGKPASRAHLLAALPVSNGELAPRFAAFALARVGLAGQWQRVPLRWLGTADLPMVARLADGGAIVIEAVGDDGLLTIRDAAGPKRLAPHALQPLVRDDLLACGALDPENGATDEQDRELIARNPRLWLLGAYLGEKRRLAQMVAASLLLNLCALAVPLYMRAIYDRVVPNLAVESLWALSLGMVIALVFEMMLKRVKSGFVDGVGLRVGQAVQHRAIHAVLDARGGGAAETPGAMMTALRDVEQLALLAPQAIATFCVDLPCFLAFAGVIAMIAGWAMVAPLLGGVALLAVGFVTNYALKHASRRVSRLMQARANVIFEIAEGRQTIKANLAEGRFLSRWDVLADHIGTGGRDTRHWAEIPAVASGFIVQMVTVLVVVIGVLQIKAGVMTSGALIAAVMLSGRAMGPISSVIATLARLYQSQSQLNGLAAILQAPPERRLSDPAIAAVPIKGRICAERLSHRFDGTGEAALHEVSFTIEPGERVALIGKSGSGKSTLLRLLAGLVPKQSGALTVDGHAIEHFAAAQLRQNLVLAAQDATLFDASIWDNLLLGMHEPEAGIVEQAISRSGLDSFVARTVDGYMRKVGPRGSALSGGQRQALVLARALLRDPRVLLLDEPTAAMDVTSEQAVIAGLRQSAEGRTLIVSTHRLALLDVVDRVIWLDGGRVVADRPKGDVLAMLRGGKPVSAVA